jgi:hypothetical protein
MKQTKMKNIHVLPTEKPSYLAFDKDNKLCIRYANKFTLREEWVPQNIYITSDEEIKEGQNYIGDGFSGKNNFKWHKSQLETYPNIKRDVIILTTDQDLIKDGVQAIDDDFLEWFVENPSCEEVEVQDISMQYHDEGYYEYKIIIPKEETIDEGEGEAYRQELFNYLYDNFGAIASELEMRDIEIIVLSTEALKDKQEQETLEEVAEKFAKKFGSEIDSTRYYAFINGAKWQQEQAKEMEKQKIIEFTNDFIEKHTFGDYDGIVQKNKTVDEYYNETFKNK